MCIRDRYATVVDSDGDALEDYDSAVCTVTAIPEVVVSSDLSGIVEVPQGSTKDFVEMCIRDRHELGALLQRI